MPAPPQYLQWLLRWLCSQMLAPPQSLHWLLMRLCSQMPAPLQSWLLLLRRLCSQMPGPPQSLHWLLMRLCSHFLRPSAMRSPSALPPPFTPAPRLPLLNRIVGLLPRRDAVISPRGTRGTSRCFPCPHLPPAACRPSGRGRSCIGISRGRASEGVVEQLALPGIAF